ncbi:ABC transporter permease [Trichlorobacter ammonificans]|uniref:Aliphatic sulfonates transport permease protein SsuC n=1 Tax=Trichlorobacter ammonificans TaxID=2916410 RepID=A0ABN8HGU7_9BACT|nr:ABC transporter permease [Trichlorobacter ammonificans]CAH2031984.1 Putative aliphatic sulfonates transport permease protein SsuC [Trichlorobacter ammonificans]
MPADTLITNQFRLRWWNIAFRELGAFLRGSFGSIVSREFLTVLIPLLILWELLPRLGVVPETLVPTPSKTAITFKEMALNLNLLFHLKASAIRFGLGFAIALITAFPIGVLMGWNLFIRKHVLPLFQILAPVPPPAWVPITIILLGVGLPMQVFLIFLGVFYPILFNTYQGIKETDPRYLASARVFGASEFTLITRVYIWHALGSVIMGIKIGIALGLIMLVIAEMYGGNSGIGFLLLEAKEFFQIDRMVVCMVILGFIGWFLIEVMKYIELKLAVWRIGR